MGNVNCSPSDCVNMRPGQAAQDCFQTPGSRSQNQLKINSGTPQELLEEWNQVSQQVANAFSEDPESNLYVLKLSKALLTHLFDHKNKTKAKKTDSQTLPSQPSPQPTSSSQFTHQKIVQKSSISNSFRSQVLQQMMKSPVTASSMRATVDKRHTHRQTQYCRNDKCYDQMKLESMQQQQSEFVHIVRQFGVKELLALINAHTSYPSDFLPIAVQAEPLDNTLESSPADLVGDGTYLGRRQNQQQSQQLQQTLPQLKAKYEAEVMHSSAVLVLADTRVVRRFDFQMPEQLRFTSFTLEKLQVSPGSQIEMKARQLLNQVREFFHLHNKLVIGGLQLIENEFQCMFVQGCKEEICPRQQNWPKMLAGELIHSLSLLPGLMQKDEYKDTHVLQCIIRIQAYTYGRLSNQRSQKGSGSRPAEQEFTKQVHFLVIFKENLYLPKRLNYLLQLQKDVALQNTIINERQVLNMIYNLAPKSFLFILSLRKLPYGAREHKAQIKKMAERLHLQEKAYRNKRKAAQAASGNNRNDNEDGAGDAHERGVRMTNQATGEVEESKDDFDFSEAFNAGQMNKTHTIDQLMFRSHQARPTRSMVQLRGISMLAEDIESFAKVKSDNLVDILAAQEHQRVSTAQGVSLPSNSNTTSSQQDSHQNASSSNNASIRRQLSPTATSAQKTVNKIGAGAARGNRLKMEGEAGVEDLDAKSKLEKILSAPGYDAFDGEQVDNSHIARYGPLKGDYLADFSMMTIDGQLTQSHQKRRPVIYAIDSCQKIGRIEGVGYVHYDSELLQTDQVVKKVMRDSLPIEVRNNLRNADAETGEHLFGDGVKVDRLRYLGVEGHWKIYYEENSLNRFVYVTSRTQFVFNCIYEVQLYKSRVESCGLFGREIVFVDEREEPVAMAVQVTRPALYLDDLVFNVWSSSASGANEQHLEHFAELKIFYIIFQVVTQVKTQVIERGLVHNCLCLRSFSFDRLSWQLKLTNFVFAQVADLKGKKKARGGLSGLTSDRDALIALIEDLAGLEESSGQLKVALCDLSDMIQSGCTLKAGVQAVLEATRQKLISDLKSIIEIFSSEDKLKPAFDFLLHTLGLDPQLHNPFTSLAVTAQRREDSQRGVTLADLSRSAPQVMDKLCQIIVYERQTPNHEIIKELRAVQDCINGAIQTISPNQIEEESKERTLDNNDEAIVLDFSQLKPLEVEPSRSESDTYIDRRAAQGLALLYYFLERYLNHVNGNMNDASQLLLQLKDLFSYDYDNLHYIMIKLMMADLRLQLPEPVTVTEQIKGMAQVKLHLLLNDDDANENKVAESMLEDLYLGQVKLVEVIADLPWYFKQRRALNRLQNGKVKTTEILTKLVLLPEFSGVPMSKYANHDILYLTFYNMQRLMLMFIYHGIVCPDEDYPFASLDEFENSSANTAVSKLQSNSPLKRASQGHSRQASSSMAASSSSSAFSQKAAVRRPPLYLQLQRYFNRLFVGVPEAQQGIQRIFCEFQSTVLCLQLSTKHQQSYDEIRKFFCAATLATPAKTTQPPTAHSAVDTDTTVAMGKQLAHAAATGGEETSFSIGVELENTADSAGAKQLSNPNSQSAIAATANEDIQGTTNTASLPSETARVQSPTLLGKDTAEAASSDCQSKGRKGHQSINKRTKFWRTEQILQMIYARLDAFDKQLVIEQHAKFFRKEYYRAAYLGERVSRYNEASGQMEAEDLIQEFVGYLAQVLEIDSNRVVDGCQIEAYEASKRNFLRCPCCPVEKESYLLD